MLYYIFSSSECVGMLIFRALALLQHPRDAPTCYVVYPRVRAVAGANVERGVSRGRLWTGCVSWQREAAPVRDAMDG